MENLAVKAQNQLAFLIGWGRRESCVSFTGRFAGMIPIKGGACGVAKPILRRASCKSDARMIIRVV
ncbi:hypothetical protein HK28_04620 [Acetobacter sp. DsW_063]|nr:hypothetical protein HK28_04620 [Acetobacter sp. DsW_063]